MAFEWFRKAAEKEYLLSMNTVGQCYYNGYGVEKNIKKALEWWLKAANLGYANSQYNYANCHKNGEGVTVN